MQQHFGFPESSDGTPVSLGLVAGKCTVCKFGKCFFAGVAEAKFSGGMVAVLSTT